MELVAARAAGPAQSSRGSGRLRRSQRPGNSRRSRARGFGGDALPLGDQRSFRRGRGPGVGKQVGVDKVGRHYTQRGEHPNLLLVLGAKLHSPAPGAAVAGGAVFPPGAAFAGTVPPASGSVPPSASSFTKVSTFTVTLRTCPVCCGAATMLSMIRKRGDLSTRFTNLESAA